MSYFGKDHNDVVKMASCVEDFKKYTALAEKGFEIISRKMGDDFADSLATVIRKMTMASNLLGAVDTIGRLVEKFEKGAK